MQEYLEEVVRIPPRPLDLRSMLFATRSSSITATKPQTRWHGGRNEERKEEGLLRLPRKININPEPLATLVRMTNCSHPNNALLALVPTEECPALAMAETGGYPAP